MEDTIDITSESLQLLNLILFPSESRKSILILQHTAFVLATGTGGDTGVDEGVGGVGVMSSGVGVGGVKLSQNLLELEHLGIGEEGGLVDWEC